MPETIAVRADERLDPQALEAYVRARFPDLPQQPLVLRQFPAGHSNLTYLLQCGPWQAVLRRPPLGPVPPRAHDMAREYRILERLHPSFPLAPRPFVLCEDPAVLGVPFYLMERRRGLVLDGAPPADWPDDPDRNRRIGEALVATLVELHQVDWRTAGLGDIGRPDGYLERQVGGWLQRWQGARTADDPPELGPLAEWFVARLPRSPAATVIHNDYKLNNALLDATNPTRLVAVLDWEMATVGDPLSDLATMLAYWTESGDEAVLGGMVSATVAPGFPTRREVADSYARLSGRDLARLDYYLAFAYFKVAVILQQIFFRWHTGQTRDQRFAHHGTIAQNLVRQAVRTARITHD